MTDDAPRRDPAAAPSPATPPIPSHTPGRRGEPAPAPSLDVPAPARAAADARAEAARLATRPAPHALARWSERRRRVAEADGTTAVGAADGAKEGAPSAPPGPEPCEATRRREADREANRAAAEAIDVDALGPGADVSVLLREGVPDALRRRALGALWRSDPVFANVDRLCDYDDDFRDPRMVLEVLQSAWQAGRGYLVAEDDAEDDGEDGAEDRGERLGDVGAKDASGTGEDAGGSDARRGAEADPGGALAASSVRPPEPAAPGAGEHCDDPDRARPADAAPNGPAMEDPVTPAHGGDAEDVGAPSRASTTTASQPSVAGRSPAAHSLRARLGL